MISLVQMIKDGVVKLTVEHMAENLKKQGWERIGQQPQALPLEEPVKVKRTRKPKEAK